MKAITTRGGFAIWWKDFERWAIPPNLILRHALRPGWKRVRLHQLIRQVRERVKTVPARKYNMAGVKWYGEGIFRRETVRGADMSASYVTPLVPGALIYNRLFAWKASFAVVPPDFADCYVSNEFPQFVTDPDLLLSDYLYLFCTRATTIHAVNAASTGSAAVSRNRFKEEQFLDFEIPLPPTAEQHAIVARWREVRAKIARIHAQIHAQKVATNARFLADLGLKAAPLETPRAGFTVWWKDFLRWSVSYNQQRQSGVDLTEAKFPVVELGSMLELVQYGTSVKANENEEGVAIVRMNNIVEGELDLSHLKHVCLPEGEVQKLLLQEGDILFNRTNSKELVGKCAVYHANGAHVFASYLIRVRANPELAIPDFLAQVVNSPIGRGQIDALSRQIIGQANVNTKELRGLQIPLPPLPLQQNIVRRLQLDRAEIASQRAAAVDLKSELESEIDEFVNGGLKRK